MDPSSNPANNKNSWIFSVRTGLYSFRPGFGKKKYFPISFFYPGLQSNIFTLDDLISEKAY